MGERNDWLKARELLLTGDAKAAEEQRKAGRQTARERIAGLLDPATFVELDAFAEEAAVVVGFGLIEERPVYVWAQDATVLGGSMGEKQARKIGKALELAGKTGTPVVALCDSQGARLTEGVAALSAYAEVAQAMSALSGVVPQIAVVMGPCIGTSALLATLCDFVIGCDKTASLLVAPAATGYADEMPADIACMVTDDEAQALSAARTLVSLLPSNSADDAPMGMGADDWNRAIPAFAQGQIGDAMEAITALADHGIAHELYAAWGRSLVTAFAGMGGRTVGIVASQAAHEGGALCPAACDKAARFIRLCDAYHIPVVSLVDTVGLAHAASSSAMLKSAGRLLSVLAAATTPKISVLAGKAIGMGYVVMGSKALGADVCYAWPGATLLPMDGVAMAQIMAADKIGSVDPVGDRQALGDDYAAEHGDPMLAAQANLIDDVIEPEQTRTMLIAALEMLAGKRVVAPPRKQHLMPL